MLATVHIKKVILRSNCEYNYFGNVLEYEYDYSASYSSMSMSTPKVLVLKYKYTSTVTPSLIFLMYLSYNGTNNFKAPVNTKTNSFKKNC